MVVDAPTDEEIDRLFHALADRTRRDIVERTISGGHSVSELASRYDMSFAAVQKHVAVLERADLVRKERRGRQQIVHTNIDAVRRAQTLLDEIETLWRDRMTRFAFVLDDAVHRPTPRDTAPQTTSQQEGTAP